MIRKCFDGWIHGFGFFTLFGIDVADSGKFGIRARERVANNLLSARPVANDAETNLIVSAQHGEAADAGGDLSEKCAA